MGRGFNLFLRRRFGLLALFNQFICNQEFRFSYPIKRNRGRADGFAIKVNINMAVFNARQNAAEAFTPLYETVEF